MKKLIFITLVIAALIALCIAPAFSQIVHLHLKYYDVTFDESKKAPICNYYTFTKANLNNSGAKRSASFHQDKLIPSKFQASGKDYTVTNKLIGKDKDRTFDKGHLVPDDDMRMNKQSELSCMTYANTAPQISSFNEILWRGIETYVRNLGANCDSIQIWTGCIYGPQSIGSGVSVPTYYYKVIRCYGSNTTAEAFICSNEPHTDKVVSHYIVPISEIEARTGLTFIR